MPLSADLGSSQSIERPVIGPQPAEGPAGKGACRKLSATRGQTIQVAHDLGSPEQITAARDGSRLTL